jgi:site-specific recombinase XerD
MIQLRHTAATAMLAAGEDPMAVANFLGHKNLATLPGYAETPEAQRAKTTAAMDRFLKAG